MARPRRIVRVAALLVILVVSYGLVEATAWTFLLLHDSELFSFASHQHARAAILAARPTQAGVAGHIPLPTINAEVLHPYLGFVLDPDVDPSASRYGFTGHDTPFAAPRPGRIVVAVLGGSFAHGMVVEARDALTAAIRRAPGRAGAEVVVENLALGGYKQPQQLLALGYFLALDAHFDAVVSLDGFNEVALVPAEYGGMVFPFYPRGWPARVGNLVDEETLRLVGRLDALDGRMRTWARLFSHAPLRWSVAANVVWRYRQEALAAERLHAAAALEAHATSCRNELGYVATGPPFPQSDTAAVERALVDVWARSSEEMHALCAARGISYLHFLQPNQYVAGSKPMGRAERRTAVSDHQPYRRGVELGYPLLVARGRALHASGIDFYDLTRVFAHHPEPLYVDDCCHVSAAGYRLVADAIGTAVGRALPPASGESAGEPGPPAR